MHGINSGSWSSSTGCAGGGRWRLLTRAIAQSPGNAYYYSDLGVAYSYLGRSGDAIAAFQRALQLRPDLAHTQRNLGDVLYGLGAGTPKPSLAIGTSKPSRWRRMMPTRTIISAASCKKSDAWKKLRHVTPGPCNWIPASSRRKATMATR